MTREEAVAKIRKCLALARNEGASQAEAERALAQAEKLMRLYDVEEADATIAQANAGTLEIVEIMTDISPTFTKVGFSNEVPSWVGFILSGLMHAYDIHIKYTYGSDGFINAKFCGTFVDASAASMLCNYLVDTTFLAAKQYPGGRSDKNSFRQGMAAALHHRLKALKSERAALPAPERTGGGTALVVLSEAKQNALAVRYPERAKQRTKTTKVRANSAYYAGVAKGNTVQLNKQIA